MNTFVFTAYSKRFIADKIGWRGEAEQWAVGEAGLSSLPSPGAMDRKIGERLAGFPTQAEERRSTL
jgi:hypothetical protein